MREQAERGIFFGEGDANVFKNMGGKIKKLAKFLCWVGIIVSIVGGIGIIATAMDGAGAIYVEGIGRIENGAVWMMGLGAVVAVLGSLFSYIGTMYLYGFGELVQSYQLETAVRIKNAQK